jgi:hypothetical protein
MSSTKDVPKRIFNELTDLTGLECKCNIIQRHKKVCCFRAKASVGLRKSLILSAMREMFGKEVSRHDYQESRKEILYYLQVQSIMLKSISGSHP